MQQRLHERTKQTAIQSILYIAATLIPFLLVAIDQNLKSYDPTVRFIIGTLVKLFIPCQGIFNFLIYIRPRIISKREKDGDSSSIYMMVWRLILNSKSRENPNENKDFALELASLPADS
jgi:hypothetical protein